mmetsp:Transcript_43759/g.133163  ORF Transcript_43759/g.133163 Transcript_43759/m.133163 type:complete len:737 (-) Transcript_43759:275-2485(-)
MGGTQSRRDDRGGGGVSNPNDADDATKAVNAHATPVAAADDVMHSPMISSPMISTPRVVTLPDLDARDREDSERQAKRERERERRAAASERAERRRRRARSASLGDERDGADAEGGAQSQSAEHAWAGHIDETTRLVRPNDAMGTYSYMREVGEGEDSPDQEGHRRRRIVNIRSSSELKSGKGAPVSTGSLTSFFSLGGPSSGTPSPTPSTPSYVHEFKNEGNPVSMSILYGLINTAIVLPVIMSFGSIIYQDEAFRPYLPVLVKLTVFSGVVHQLCFSTFSTLPFAVGQVQDAGLIFLSAMTSDMVKRCRDGGHSDEELLATVTVGLGLFTAILGFGLVVIGRCRLASYVQLLPTPVVGGYLAFIGFFCGQSGMGLMAGVNVSGVAEWGQLFADGRARLVLPGIAGGLLIYVAVRTVKHFAVLPACIVFLVGLFYMLLGITETSVEEARDAGWISDADAPPVWYHTWDYLRPTKVVWSALPPQSLTVLSMIFVVALSSSLDVAAIELELGRPLDYNRELRTVGISNAISGLTGGYTGSYIFSQSIFALRAGIRSRLQGYVLALVELVTVLLPFSILSYVPNFFFGSLLVMIALDLCYEWLWDVRSKVTKAEYSVALATFALIQMAGVEYGIFLGIAFHVILSKLGFEMTPPGGAVDGGGSLTSPHARRGGSDGDSSAEGKSPVGSSPKRRTITPNESGGSLGIFIDYEVSGSDNDEKKDEDGDMTEETTHVTLLV